jgi:phage N-6-adenine-methyltransferase
VTLTTGMFTSDRLDWATPQPFFDLVDDEFHFTLDAAASPHTAKVGRYYTEREDGLSQPWVGTVWCNPPYGRGIAAWIKKGFDEAQLGSTVVMLIPARTETAYWHDYVMRAAEVRFIRGRLVFGQGEATSNAPFPSALVVFRDQWPPGRTEPAFSAMERGRITKRAVA